ncbi:MAG: FixG Ig-like domain-containing protein, partial [Hyphococcus sp.]
VMLFGLLSRATLEVNVLRDRTPPFVQLSDGSVRNAYTLKIVNKANMARDFVVTVAGPDALTIDAIGEDVDGASLTVTAEGDAVRSVRLFATLPEAAILRASEPIEITVEDAETGEMSVNPTVFLADRRQ